MRARTRARVIQLNSCFLGLVDHQHALLSLQLQFCFDDDEEEEVIFRIILDSFKEKCEFTLSAQRLLADIKVNFYLTSTQQKRE